MTGKYLGEGVDLFEELALLELGGKRAWATIVDGV